MPVLSPISEGEVMTLNPFPSAPSKPGKYSVKIIQAEKDMLHVHAFTMPFAAKKLIEALIGDDDYKEINDHVIKTDRGIKIKCEFLIEVMNHKYTKEEKEWSLPVPYPRMVQLFRGEQYNKDTSDVPMNPDKPAPQVKPTRKEKPAPVPRKPKPDGLVTIQDICAEMKLEPSKARAHLRSSKTPKPDHGWAWPAKEADAIRKLLRGVR